MSLSSFCWLIAFLVLFLIHSTECITFLPLANRIPVHGRHESKLLHFRWERPNRHRITRVFANQKNNNRDGNHEKPKVTENSLFQKLKRIRSDEQEPVHLSSTAVHHHKFGKWTFYPTSDDQLQIHSNIFPDTLEFYVCDSEFFEENPFRTRGEIVENCKLIEKRVRSFLTKFILTQTGKIYNYEHFGFNAPHIFPAAENVPTDGVKKYRLVAVSFDRENHDFEQKQKVHVMHSPAFVLILDKNNERKIRIDKETAQTTDLSLMADNLWNFDQSGMHRLSYEIDGTEGVEAIKKLIRVADLSEMALIGACRSNDEDALRFLLSIGMNANIGNGYWTPLEYCSEHGYIELMQILLEHGADVNLAHKKGRTPLQSAAYHNQMEAAKFLLDAGAEVNLADYNGETALSLAAPSGNNELVQMLIDHGAIVDAEPGTATTPLQYAAIHGQDIIARLLLDNLASIEVQNKKKESALYLACENGREEVVTLLLRDNAPVNTQGPDGNTPLMAAISRNNSEIVRILLEYGADTTAQNSEGYTALMLAVRQPLPDIVRLLAEHGANLDFTDKKGNNALSEAISYLELADNIDSSSWIQKICHDSVEIISILLEFGANPNIVNRKNGETPLFSVVRNGNCNVVQLLLSHGATIDHVNLMGERVLDIAANQIDSDMWFLLTDYLKNQP